MKHFWRKPGKTLIYLLSLFLAVGLLGTRVYALDNGETQPTDGNDTPVETDPQENEDSVQEETKALSAVSITPLLQTDAPKDLTDYLNVADHKEDLVVDMYEVASFFDNSFSVKKDSATGKAVFDLTGYDLNKGFLLEITEGEGGTETDNFAAMIKKWDKLAQTLAGQVKTGDAGKPKQRDVPLGEIRQSLEPGLYLILAHGKGLEGPAQFEEIDVEQTDPTDPKKILTTIMETDSFTYNFRPVLIVAPTKSADKPADANQKESKEEPPHIATSDAGKWVYDVNVYLKPSQKPLEGNLKIIKTIPAIDDRLDDGKVTPVTVVFTIKGWKTKTNDAGEQVKDEAHPVYMNVASITLPNKDNFVILEHIPVGTWIEVTEEYTGSGYAKDKNNPGPNPEHVIIKASTDDDPKKDENIVSVTFSNEYHDELKKGYGVMNTYTKADSTETPWTLERTDNQKPASGGNVVQ